MLNINKLAAFTMDGKGGNPAGVVLLSDAEDFPDDDKMMAVASELGYSETVFAKQCEKVLRVRYFSPDQEVDFCGHATIALGGQLLQNFGPGTYILKLNHSEISIEARKDGSVSLQSPPTCVKSIATKRLKEYLDTFSLSLDALEQDFPAQIANAGNDHLILAVQNKHALDAMEYDFDKVKDMMTEDNIVTIALFYRESPKVIHIRNAFAYGGVTEDPATGAAAAALMGYLREHQALSFEGEYANVVLYQGQKMGVPCVLNAQATKEANSSIKLSGRVRRIE